MAAITRRLMRNGLATMRELLDAIATEADEIGVADAFDASDVSGIASPLVAHLPTLRELATAVERDDELAVARLETEIRSWPFVRATLIVPGQAMGEAEVLYLFRKGTHALLTDGVVISLGLFAPGGTSESAMQEWEWGEQVEVGDVVVYGADGARATLALLGHAGLG